MQKLAKLMTFTLALGCASAWAADRPADSAMTPPAAQGRTTPGADNTGMNVRDKSGATQTPQKQTNRVADRKRLASVRRAIVRDKSLSSAGHNVKIVVQDGMVTLRGPVRNQNEKTKIEKLAQQVAGVTSVENELDIKTK